MNDTDHSARPSEGASPVSDAVAGTSPSDDFASATSPADSTASADDRFDDRDGRDAMSSGGKDHEQARSDLRVEKAHPEAEGAVIATDSTPTESVLRPAAPTPPHAGTALSEGAASTAHTAEPDPSAHSAASPSPAVREAPRTRWGGIIWGLVFLALAGVGFWSTTALSADFLADIWLRITPLAVGAGMVLIVGGIAMLCALVALARHLQRRSAAQRSPL